ncbi:phosphatase PAP2 family protein [Lapillicoccus jejuensis]|uniref:Undecaprenyl-diphosphatase n=1 Tax=Lapillicoccus jejuensis TaxID=402171 RepID=A0A542DXB8_9MICO|nr:phosphatase PAP2 family protein [Lapillicoccus jejuensis]TQJ07564.1 undecaprenyl-diphosphatase [Lapillicoccus jejuensis]
MALVDGSRPRSRREGADRPWTSEWVHRWDDLTVPPWRDVVRDVGRRLLLPALVLWLAILAVGFLIQDGLHSFQSESAVNRALQSTRTSTWDAVTAVWSHIGNTEIVIGVCVVMVGVVLALTRRWSIALVPAIAISLQATVFVVATEIVGRPRPDVPHLDPAPPTSSYPSGHVGASTALYLSLALLAQRVRHPLLRRVLTAVCVVIPLLVLYARLYRGMHHLTDVLVGLVNGIVCATLAWGYLRERRTR